MLAYLYEYQGSSNSIQINMRSNERWDKNRKKTREPVSDFGVGCTSETGKKQGK